MQEGMLWYDDDDERTLEEKVRRAADYYRDKYGRPPDLCLVNPRALNGRSIQVAQITLRAASNVLMHHLLIGVAEKGNGSGRGG
jgi:hypothetical protein